MSVTSSKTTDKGETEEVKTKTEAKPTEVKPPVTDKTEKPEPTNISGKKLKDDVPSTPNKLAPEIQAVLESQSKMIKGLEEKLIQMDYRLADRKPEDQIKVRGPEQLDPKDMLDKPAVFFCFKAAHFQYGYTKNGVEVLTPFGRPIVYSFYTRYERPSKSGKGMDSITISRAVIYSKKERDWVKTHPDHDVNIYSDVKQVQNIDITLQEKMSDVAAQISILDDHQVIQRVRAEIIKGASLQVIEDVGLLRKNLIQHLAMQEVSKERQKMANEVQEMSDIRDQNKKAFATQSV